MTETSEQLLTQVQALQTEKKDLSEKLAVANQKIIELESFIHVASHDLQEPLRKIKTFGEILQNKAQDVLNERQHKYLNYIVTGAVRMQQLLEDLVQFSRAIKISEKEVVDLDRVVKTVLDDLGLLIAEKGAQVEVQTLPELRANAVQMQQLFQNLISNALKFCRQDPQIQITVQSQAEDWQFSVQDNGIGIAAADTERIFTAFQRLHNKKDYPGSGLGLAICQKVILQHQGRIWIESTPGQGSRFCFTLPKELKS